MPARQSQAGLEVHGPHSDLEHNPHAAVYPGQGPPFYGYYSRNESDKAGAAALPSGRRICGLSRKAFVILVAAAIIIIAAAALGGGLGSGLSAKNNTTASPQQTTAFSALSTSSSAPGTSTVSSNLDSIVTAVSSSPDSIVTAEVGTVSGSSVTLYRDCPSSNNSLYSIQYSSTTYEFRKLCNMQFVNANQPNNRVGQPASSLNDCVNLCASWNENNVTKGNADQVCSAVCWRYGFLDDDMPGQCFGYTTTNVSSGVFNVRTDAICDSAVWINQP